MLYLNRSSGNVGIGTTSPGQKLDVNGGVKLESNGATVAGDVYLCITPTTGVVTQGALCAASSQKVKENINVFSSGLADIMKLSPVSFNYKFGFYGGKQDIGLIAESVAAVDPRFAIYAGADQTLPDGSVIHAGDPMALNTSAILSATVEAVQEMNLNLEGVAGTVIPLPGSASDGFVTAFMSNIKATIGSWLADAGNGLADIFVKQVDTKTLCVSDDSGAKTCLTKAQLDSLLGNVNASVIKNVGNGTVSTQGNVGIGTVGVGTTDAQPTPEATAGATIDGNIGVGTTDTQPSSSTTTGDATTGNVGVGTTDTNVGIGTTDVNSGNVGVGTTDTNPQ